MEADRSPLVGELVRQRMSLLTPAERRLARVLLASYPIAGLETLARFAERGTVSPPTVTRFIAKLGFRGYPEFQDVLRSEVQARLSSPLVRFETGGPAEPQASGLSGAFATLGRTLARTVEMVPEEEFWDVADILADRRRRLLVVGGRVTSALARYLAGQLNLLRPGVQVVDSLRRSPVEQMIDLGKNDVLVVFDYRRYQKDTIDTARTASRRGAVVVLLTDPWLSPAAAFSRHVLTTSVEAAAAFDSMVAATALVEALVTAVLSRLGEEAHERMRRLEEVRAGATWGEDDGPAGRGSRESPDGARG